ncbi:unnamed protein product [Notodromas monacha]|uniref:alpha-mannosidase n=1 Tax=Notodromas monacha TaxID=399045 RepID=A0A7R9BPY7_9CRUS|nr:unnamed protein product [Notodromas monacha]CAG0918169.1 unnamed protein product [Notodromas monacha]
MRRNYRKVAASVALLLLLWLLINVVFQDSEPKSLHIGDKVDVYSLMKMEDEVMKLSVQHLDDSDSNFIKSSIKESSYNSLNMMTFSALDKFPRDGVISWNEYLTDFLMKLGVSLDGTKEKTDEAAKALNRTMKEEIMGLKAAWFESVRGDPDRLNIDEFLAFRHPEQSHSFLLKIVEDVANILDTNGDGVLNLGEFTELKLDDVSMDNFALRSLFDKDLKTLFKVVDIDGKGTVNRQELLAYLDMRNPIHARREARRLVQTADSDRNGRVSANEAVNKGPEFLACRWFNPDGFQKSFMCTKFTKRDILFIMDYVASLRKNKRTTLERMEKFISTELFTDVNLHGQRYSAEKAVTDLSHWAGKDSEKDWRKYPFSIASVQTFKPVNIGDSFGPTWATHWFKVIIDIPESWKGETVHLIWNSSTEALLWSEDGKVVQGFSCVDEPGREYYVLAENFAPTDSRRVYFIEMACNGSFGAGANAIGPPDMKKEFKLEICKIAVFNKSAYSLAMDLEILASLAREDPSDGFTAHKALFTGNHMLNLMQAGKTDEAHKVAKEFFKDKQSKSLDFTVVAVGNCHIDSAWLWPVRETIRKCARSFSNAIRLMELYPEFIFVASQAQQFEWIKDYYPSLFTEIKGRVKEGRFVPVGGTWVEMDGNIPSGEAYVRHFLLGQKFFLEEFGKKCSEFWLPDTFGYSAQIPQILQHVGISNFLTQKISWNVVNKFPHHSFVWEGLDGSTVLSHFPPSNSYTDRVKVANVVELVKNYSDKGRASQAIMLYGFGDGGGGATQDMLERRRRLENIPGYPKLKPGVPSEVFDQLAKESKNLCRWVGELYLEMHNGTYTTQATIKKQNRRCEELLRNVELLLAMLVVHESVDEKLLKKWQGIVTVAWKKLLLNQFHDILPGSSIEMVNVDAREAFEEISNNVGKVFQEISERFFGTGRDGNLLLNTLAWKRRNVVKIPRGGNTRHVNVNEQSAQQDDQGTFIVVEAPQMSVVQLLQQPMPEISVKTEKLQNGNFVLSNAFLRAEIDTYGRITSTKLSGSSKDAICQESKLANSICIYDDIPLFWDAWDVMDYHLETRKILNAPNVEGVKMKPARILQNGPLVSAVEWEMSFGNGSKLSQRIILDAESPYLIFETNVDWKESHKILKAEFPLNVLARNATYEIQYGHVERPTHANTSWDWAKYEVVGHRWADMSECGFGVSLLSECKYGWSSDGNKLSLSLLRAPKSPDANADIGAHAFKYALMPHAGTFQSANVIQRAHEFNQPLKILHGAARLGKLAGAESSWIEVDQRAVILDAVKLSDNFKTHRAVVLRFYESFGSHVPLTNVTLHFPVKAVTACNGLEEPLKSGGLKLNSHGASTSFAVDFKPFQIQSFLVELF